MKNDINEKDEDKLIIDKTFSHSNNQLTVVTANGYNLAKVSLDNHFFENLLILEMNLESEFSMEKLFELIKQYSIAIEYYLQKEPAKAKAYQNRMEYLLTNKDTLIQLKRQNDQINNNKNENKNKEKNNINNKVKSEIIKKKETIKFRQDFIKAEDLTKRVTFVLNSSNKKGENTISGKNIINNDLEKQNLNWKERLKNKKKNPSRFSVKPSIGGIRKKYQSIGKFDLNLSPNSSEPNLEENNKQENDEIKATEFKTVFEELYDKKEKEDILVDEDRKEEDVNMNRIEDNKIVEIKEDENEENMIDENNKEEGKKNIGDIKNEIIEVKKNQEDKKEEQKENDNIEKIKEEKEENVINEKNEDEKSKEQKQIEEPKDKNEIIEIKEEEKENENNINLTSLEKAIESSKIDSGKKNQETTSQSPFQELLNVHRRMSLLEEDLIDNGKPDEEIKNSIESQITSLKNIISNLNKKNTNQNEVDIVEEEESEFSSSNTNLIKIKPNLNNLDKIPGKFQGAYIDIETIMGEYVNDFNQFFYKEIFEPFSSELKDLYNMKYKKYIEIRNEYHAQIKENEYLLELDDNLSKEKKEEIQQTIDSLNEELQHQIDVVEDEFNQKISDKISEFKRSSFKHNSGIQLLEEKVKLDIYSLINDAF